MSVDQRLRQGLRATGESFQPAAAEAYTTVVLGQRRRQRRRRVLVAASAGLLVAGVLGLQPLLHLRSSPEITHYVPTPRHPMRSSGSTVVHSPVDGHWTTGVISMTQMTNNLRDAGLQQWSRQFMKVNANASPSTTFEYVVSFQDGHLTQLGSRDGGPQFSQDDETFAVVGHVVTFHPGPVANVYTKYRWSIGSGNLTLAFITSTEGLSSGIPGEVYQRAFYSTVPYHRVP